MADKITPSNIDDAEQETIRIANSTIIALESALAAWDATKNKPKNLQEKFKKYGWFRDALADWLTMMLKANGSGDFKARQARLAEFAAMCSKYKEGA